MVKIQGVPKKLLLGNSHTHPLGIFFCNIWKIWKKYLEINSRWRQRFFCILKTTKVQTLDRNWRPLNLFCNTDTDPTLILSASSYKIPFPFLKLPKCQLHRHLIHGLTQLCSDSGLKTSAVFCYLMSWGIKNIKF